mmetsp:Transcript_87305/g.154735  ORF Transcript_87305/g.154735 Transcript_87305/m.154735 type:complete len:833 (+) Transcript_87305:42-2540(+)
MFRDRWKPQSIANGSHEAAPPAQASNSKSCKLMANCFRIVWNPQSVIHSYAYILPNPKARPQEEKHLLEQAWPKLEEKFGVFVVRCPGYIFSPRMHNDFTIAVTDSEGKSCEIQVKLKDKIIADQVNSGMMGKASVVSQHLVNKMASLVRNQRVGRRYFNNFAMAGKAQLTLITGFCVALNTLTDTSPAMQLDVMHRPLQTLTIIEAIRKSIEGDPLVLTDSDVLSEWQRRCVSATVITTYNNRVYRIKKVHFDKTPASSFKLYQRDQKKTVDISYAEYYQAFYDKAIGYGKQPLLEAYAEKDGEEVFLLPELCRLTGINDEIRKDKNLHQEAMKQAKVSPQERLNAITNLTQDMIKDDPNAEAGSSSAAPQCLEEWNCQLEKAPMEVDAHVLEPLQVSFSPEKSFLIEEGGFHRFLRNGLQCPVRMTDWLFVYPIHDEPVLDIWLRSLRDIASVAFCMKMDEPKRVVCSEQIKDIENVIRANLTPTTQFVLLLTPQKDSRKVYQLFKKVTCLKIPCITQVVKSETIRKRQSIAAVLSRIVLQMNAKFCGPLWHVVAKDTHGQDNQLGDTLLGPLTQVPTMLVGVDIFQSCEGERYMGFVASLNKPFTEHWSHACALDGKTGDEWRSSLSVKLQEAFKNALLTFSSHNESLLPEHIVVYRPSVNPEEWPAVKATELEAFKAVLNFVKLQSKDGTQAQAYQPELTFITIARRGGMRFFNPSPNVQNLKNPEPGTIVDCSSVCRTDIPNFYMISQVVQKGTAVPTHYSVLCNTSNLSMEVIQNLTYRLCFLYFNSSYAVRMPSLALYAKKIASFVGTAVRAEPHPRLQTTLFYL